MWKDIRPSNLFIKFIKIANVKCYRDKIYIFYPLYYYMPCIDTTFSTHGIRVQVRNAQLNCVGIEYIMISFCLMKNFRKTLKTGGKQVFFVTAKVVLPVAFRLEWLLRNTKCVAFKSAHRLRIPRRVSDLLCYIVVRKYISLLQFILIWRS